VFTPAELAVFGVLAVAALLALFALASGTIVV
jgi:hypothetical protein